MPKHRQPADLAKDIFSYFRDLKRFVGVKPSLPILTDLLECLYFASMQTEEGELTQVTVCLFDPNLDDDDDDIEEAPKDHWQFTAFAKPIPLTVKSLVKISKAADPWSASLAVYFDELGELFIYGLIDQAIHNQSYINYELDAAPAFAGTLQASIQGIGIISVTRGRRLLGILRHNNLVTHFLDVWGTGQLSKLLAIKSAPTSKSIRLFFDKTFPGEDYARYEKLMDDIWRDTISRVLIQIRKYHHGGAILITDNKNNLNIKYPFVYKRLYFAMRRFARVTIAYEMSWRIMRRSNEIERIDFDNFIEIDFRKKEVANELKGAIRFIASQTCVDGLIVLSDKLETMGFGAVIKDIRPPKEVYFSPNAEYKPANLAVRNPDELGTRHRSMMTYCAENEGAIGIVISQDGEIRVMSLFESKLIVWENIQTQRYLKTMANI